MISESLIGVCGRGAGTRSAPRGASSTAGWRPPSRMWIALKCPLLFALEPCGARAAPAIGRNTRTGERAYGRPLRATDGRTCARCDRTCAVPTLTDGAAYNCGGDGGHGMQDGVGG